MSPLAAIAAAGLLARAASPSPTLAVAGDVQVSADRLTYEGATGRVLLEGNAVVRRGAVVIRARSASWDPTTGEVRATGGVLLTDPIRVVSADAVRAVLGETVEAEGVLALVKGEPADLSGLRSADEARRAGRNRVTLSGDRLRGTADGRMRLTGARLTLCDCPGGAAPSWEVSAREADVIPGKRAILHWPIVRITPRFLFIDRPVPVLVVPWLYLPLGERQSGILIPVVGNTTGASGFSIAEPLYLTLGRSADATLTPEYAFGRRRSDVEGGKAAVRGPGARLELRWAPVEAAEGRVELAWVDDLDAEPGGDSGDRWAVTALHGQRLGAATRLEAAVRLAGDAVWVRDMTADVLARSVPYRRSDVLVSHRRDAIVTEVSSSYDQPLRPSGNGTVAPGTIVPLGTFPGGGYGPLGADVGVASRWGSAAATLVPTAMGPLRLSARGGAARYGPAGRGLDVTGRPAATRADGRAEVALPLLVGGALTVAPFVRGAALGYAFDEAKDPAASAWGVAGAVVQTEVSRRFGPVRHAIAPRLEWRVGTGATGEALPFPAYDAFDPSTSTTSLLSARPGTFQQLRAAVETRIESGGRDLLRAELGQDVDLRAGRFAETFAALAVGAGPFGADARASFFGVESRPTPATPPRIPSRIDNFTELRANLSLADSRGDGVRLGFVSVGPGGSGTLVAGIDPLFDIRPGGVEAGGSATAAARATIGPARLAYEALIPGRAAFVLSCSGVGERRVGAFQVQQHSGTLSWESSCHCFRITAAARVNDCTTTWTDVSYFVSLDLTGLAGAVMR